MKLFGHPDSGHAFKVRFFLCAAGIEHDYEQVDIWRPHEQRSAEFQLHARFREVPTLLLNDRAIVQSNAILLHLAMGLQGWGATNAEELARTTEWLFWEANKIGLCLPQIRAHHRFPDKARLSDGALAWLQARYEHDVLVLAAELATTGAFIGGQQPGIADFSLCGYLYFADEARVTVPGHVQAWLDRLAALPGWEHPGELMAAADRST